MPFFSVYSPSLGCKDQDTNNLHHLTLFTPAGIGFEVQLPAWVDRMQPELLRGRRNLISLQMELQKYAFLFVHFF